MTNLPKYQEAPLGQNGLHTLPWRRWLEAVNTALNTAGTNNLSLAADIAAIATALGSPDGTVANIPDQDSLGDVIYGRNGVTVTGKLGMGPVYVELQPLEDSGVGSALLKITRDAYGRLEGTQAATTSDLPEGSNLYYTQARADARVTAGIATHVALADPHTQYVLDSEKGVALGVATLDSGGKLDGGQLPALAITETFVVASQAAMLALTAQEGDVAVRTDLSKSLILTASPASTLSNWQELLTPTSAVTSVFGRTGSVTAQSGDYTAAQVGAEPTITGGTTAQFWRGDKTFSDLATAVRAAVLTGLSTASASVVAATDSVLSAIGKLQAQVSLKQDAIADSGWATATLQNSWVAFGGVYAAPSYRKVGSIVYLRGVMKNGTGSTGTVVFTLPTGFRPSAAGSYSTPAPDSPTVDARVDVNTSGTVVISATMTSTTYLAIDGIQFFID